mmetsp:Transcript_57555/g.160258  ORF Transcript_57555/g.160258 Transcript_57555/m.160258 type:complete len:567 (+) Transcript_57555:479-2179(+)
MGFPISLGHAVNVDGILGLLAALHEGHRNAVALVERRQKDDGLVQQGDGIHVVFERLAEFLGLFVPQLQRYRHLVLGSADCLLQRSNLATQVVRLVLHTLDRIRGLANRVAEVLHVVRVFVLAALATVAVRDVVLLLPPEDLDHTVDGHDHRVEMPARFDTPRDVQELRGSGRAMQLGRGLPEPRARRSASPRGQGVPPRGPGTDGFELQQRGRGVLEDTLGNGAREHVDGLRNALELLGAEARPLRPLRGSAPAGGRRLRKKRLVRLELRLCVVAALLALGEVLRFRGLVAAMQGQRRLQCSVFRLLRGHEPVECLLLLGLLGVGLLQGAGEGVVQALENALDPRGLRGVVTEWILRDLEGPHGSTAAGPPGRGAGERGQRAIEEAFDSAQIRGRERPRGEGGLQRSRNAAGGLQQPGLPRRLQEAALLAARARACQDRDGGLQSADALLRLGLLVLVLGMAPRTHVTGVFLRGFVRFNVLLELVDVRAVCGHSRFQIQDRSLEFLHLRFGVADVLSFACQRILAPAGVLVVRLLFDLAIRLDRGLQVMQQLHDFHDRGRRAGVE